MLCPIDYTYTDPCSETTRPRDWRIRIASRTVGRLTCSCLQSSASGGNKSPEPTVPVKINADSADTVESSRELFGIATMVFTAALTDDSCQISDFQFH